MYLPRLTGNQCAHRERWDFGHPTLARRNSFFDDRFSQKRFIDWEKGFFFLGGVGRRGGSRGRWQPGVLVPDLAVARPGTNTPGYYPPRLLPLRPWSRFLAPGRGFWLQKGVAPW